MSQKKTWPTKNKKKTEIEKDYASKRTNCINRFVLIIIINQKLNQIYQKRG